jgi:hypothetical protein
MGSRLSVMFLVCAGMALSAGCGGASSTAPPRAAAKPAADAKALPPLPRSSIAAVLLHRQELALDDDQVREMLEIDQKLADRNAALRSAPPADDKPAKPPAGGAGRGAGGGLHMAGGRAAMGGMGAPAPPKPRSDGSAHPPRNLQDRIDDNDTKAYLEAEQVLRPEQIEPARDFAEKYREELFDRRTPE